MKNIKNFTQFINEDFVYVSQNQIPNGIKEWVKDQSGSFIKDFKIDQSGERVRVKMPWHEACTEVYQFFDLTHDNAIPVGNSVTRSGYEGNSPQGYLEGQTKEGYVEIPVGKILVVYCTYPRSVRIHTSKGAQLFLSDTSKSEDLSDEELLILQTAKSLKSFARPKFDDKFYDNLISKGLLAKNRSITNDGRNLISNPEVKEKIKKAGDNYYEKTGRYMSFL
jgi:hypothetical protein